MHNINKNQGFTLFELITVMAVVAILAAVSAPDLRQMIANNQASTYSQDVYGSIALARQEAVNRSIPVSMCALPSAGATSCATTNSKNWKHGWMVFVDGAGTFGKLDAGDKILRVYPSLKGNTVLTSNLPALTYAPTGNLASASMRLDLRVDGCGMNNNRNLLIPVSGHAYVQAAACAV